MDFLRSCFITNAPLVSWPFPVIKILGVTNCTHLILMTGNGQLTRHRNEVCNFLKNPYFSGTAWNSVTLNLLLAKAGNDSFSTDLMLFEIEMRKSLMAWKPLEIHDVVGFGWLWLGYSRTATGMDGTLTLIFRKSETSRDIIKSF